MPGRTADISTSSFKPLSLDEIMMVPLAKQKMEDDFLAKSDKLSELEASTSSVDQDRASKTLEGFKSRASGLSDNIINSGVSRSEFNKLRSLKSEVQNEYGSEGFIGKAIANKKAIGTFINDLATKKERQGGYSAAEAQKWAQKQAADFTGTQNEDGTFNSFSGAELYDKFDEDKLIDDAIKRVSGELSETSVGILATKGLPAFYEAVATQDVSGKDYNTVMASIKNASQTNPDLMRHLSQQAFFNGSEEDINDLGEFQNVPTGKKDKDGKPITSYEFVPGNSRYAKKMAGFGYMGSQKTVKTSINLIKDTVAADLAAKGYDEQKAIKMVKMTKGEYLNTKVGDLVEIQKLNDDYKVGLDAFGVKLDAKKKELEESGIDPNLDKDYINLKNDYTNSKVGYGNVNSYLKILREDSLKSLSKDERGLIEADVLLKKYDGDAVRLVEEEYQIKSGTGKGELGFGYDRYKNDTSEEGVKRYNELIEKEAKRILASRNGASSATKNPSYDYDIRLSNAIEARDGRIQDNLDANSKATPYTVLQIPSGNKYSTSKFKDFSDMNEENMDIRTVSISGENNMTLADYMETDEFVDIMGDDAFEIKKSFTIDGYSNEGKLFNQLIVRSKTDPKKSVSLQIDATGDTSIMRELYEDLSSSPDRQQALEGEKGLANLMYMGPIKQSYLRYSDKGKMIIPLPGGETTDEVTFSKNEDGTYSGTLFGVPIEFDGNLDLKGEQEFAVALKREVEDYTAAKIKLEKTKAAKK
tara:strand:- start:9402 stop:11672 length:2271 start_codon:yes stop_codon:yes gene_type:complete